jgi:hypothetical protein
VSIRRRLLDPSLHDLSPRHLEIFWRYQVVRTGVDFGAALCFVVGSVLFFSESTTTIATWLFLVGSILFAVKPTIDLIRSIHLRSMPEDGHDAGAGSATATTRSASEPASGSESGSASESHPTSSDRARQRASA